MIFTPYPLRLHIKKYNYTTDANSNEKIDFKSGVLVLPI